ncbi:hypothetical protein D3C72_1560370 [compost metagenome]
MARSGVMRSPSHSQATSAPNSGAAALSTEAMPVGMCTTAYENRANGMAELMRPENSTGRQWARSAGHSPRTSITGSRNSAASATRRPAVGTGPNCEAPRRMNRNDAPHRTASTTNSGNQRITGMDAAEGRAVGGETVCAGAWGVVVLGMVGDGSAQIGCHGRKRPWADAGNGCW